MDEYLAFEQRIATLIEQGGVSDDAFNETALAVYEFQRARNEPFNKYCRHLGVPLEIKDWRAIPAVPQSAFKHFPLRTFPAGQTVKVFRTSGTTGEGFGQHHFRSTRLYELSILCGWDAFDLPRLPQIVLTPAPDQAPHSSLSHMMGTLRARAESGGQQFCVRDDGSLDVGKISALLDHHSNCGAPVLLPGTALAFLHLFEALEERGVTFVLPAKSCALETGGYKGSRRTLSKRELYDLFTRRLGIAPGSVINEYSMTELSSQFYARGPEGTHRGPPWARALVCDPKTGNEVATGEAGVLKIVDLANLGSVLAIQTRDLAIRRERGFDLLGRDPSVTPRGCSRAADETFARNAG